MTRDEFNFLYQIKKQGYDKGINWSEGRIYGTALKVRDESVLLDLRDRGLLDDKGITQKGLDSLAPYKVDNAVIMAAGLSSRFVPLSLEKPKGLLVVKGEVLIERQIEQLQEAGIQEIILVLGYKKEAFFYLENKYEGLKIVINPEYNSKNNTNTLYLARDYIKNTYICSSDDFFEENPFEKYVFESYYAAVHVSKKTNEWYMVPDEEGYISEVHVAGDEGYIMLGHVYWNAVFSKKMVGLLSEDHGIGKYDSSLWEQILMDNVENLPPMFIKEYPIGSIFEFDTLDELRRFDQCYVNNTHSHIMHNIARALECKESDITNFKAIKEGLTNTSFVLEVRGKKYVYRHPGEGTEAIINRPHEKMALELAKSIDVDPTFIYMDAEEGWKISSFVENIRIPSYNDFADSKRILNVLKKLHQKKLSVEWTFLPWEEACKIESLLKSEKDGIADVEFETIKNAVHKCYQRTLNDGIEMCFCHCDTYAPNWMLTENKTILIDWEYAGNADPGCDIGTYVMRVLYKIVKSNHLTRSAPPG